MLDSANLPPREGLAQQMPAAAQPFITWLSGIPAAREVQRFRMTPLRVMGIGVLSILAGFGMILCAVTLPLPWAILGYLPGFFCVAGGMRRLDVLIIHQSLHARVLGSPRANRILGEVLTTLLLRVPYRENQREHLAHHRSPCSEDDGDVAFLRDAGVSVAAHPVQLYVRILVTCLSPRFHFGFAGSRLMANFLRARPLYRLVMSWAYGAALAAPALWYGAGYLQSLVLLWLLPLTIGFQISNFLYTATKHRWWLFSNRNIREQDKRDLLSYARVCCDPMPAAPTPLALLGWWARAVLVHAPTRLFIVVGDTVHHDLHHVAPTCDWPNAAAERPIYAARTPERFTEVWGGLPAHLRECNLATAFQRFRHDLPAQAPFTAVPAAVVHAPAVTARPAARGARQPVAVRT